MKARIVRRAVITAAVVLFGSVGAAQAGTIIDFEDLTAGTSFNVGDMVTTSGVDLTFEEFFWLPSGSTTDGFAEVWDSDQFAGGAGQDLETNNINVSFHFGDTLTDLSLLYGEYGGNVNLAINGDFRNEQDFDALDGVVVGGVMVNIVDLGGALRRMELAGPIENFVIGGQELWIDDVRHTIPGPGALAALAISILLFGHRRRLA